MDKPLLNHGDLEVYPLTGKVYANGKQVFLSSILYQILMVFLTHQGRVIPTPVLIRYIYGSKCRYYGKEVIWVHMSRLRAKIEYDPTEPYHILTIPTRGYKMPVLEMDV